MSDHAHILARIEANADEYGDCLIYRTKSKRPQVHMDGSSKSPAVRVQRAVWMLRGHDLPNDWCVTSRCGDPRCINPDHLVAMPAAKFAKRAANHVRRGNESLRAMKIAAAWADRRKLTDEQVAEIRVSTKTGPTLAAEYGVSTALVNKIKAGTARRVQTAGMWGQLMGSSV